MGGIKAMEILGDFCVLVVGFALYTITMLPLFYNTSLLQAIYSFIP